MMGLLKSVKSRHLALSAAALAVVANAFVGGDARPDTTSKQAKTKATTTTKKGSDASSTIDKAKTEETKATVSFNGKVEKIIPLDSGPGLLVLDPVLKDSRIELAEISRGCAAWLQFAIAGQPQCGKTAFWKSLRRVQLELGRADLRLEKKDGAKPAAYLGATHILVGTMEGNSANCTLTYQLFKTPSLQAMGDPIKIAGSKTEIANQMPKLAAWICNNLEISPEHLPDTPPSLAELTLAGKVQARTGDEIPPSIRGELMKLSTSSPLTGLIYVDTATPLDPALPEAVSNLVTQEPTNAILFGEIGWMQGKLLQWCAKKLSSNIKNYPTNYLFKTASVYLYRGTGDGKREIEAAKQCVQLAPGNPDAWLTLAQTYNYAADKLRKGRFYTELTSTEKKQFDESYPLWLGCAEQAVKIDPLFGRAWLRTSTAAAYSGFLEEADSAFEKAFVLEKDRYSVYSWGLQLYQPKWFNNAVKLREVAQAASNDRSMTDGERRALGLLVQNYPYLARMFVKAADVTPPANKH